MSKEKEHSAKELKQLPLGLEEHKSISSVLKSLKKRAFAFGNLIKYSGVYQNFWLWNIVFINLLIAGGLTLLITKNYSNLPENIGINLFGHEDYDTVISKSNLFLVILFHLVVAFVSFIFSLKAQKRLNHLLIIGFLNYTIFSFFEFYALRYLLEYFI